MGNLLPCRIDTRKVSWAQELGGHLLVLRLAHPPAEVVLLGLVLSLHALWQPWPRIHLVGILKADLIDFGTKRNSREQGPDLNARGAS